MLSVERSKQNLNAIIDQIRASNPMVEIILLTMNDVSGEGRQMRPKLSEYYQGYRDVAKRRGLCLVDSYPVWKTIRKQQPHLFKKLVPDGVHPQAPGYRTVLLPLLVQALTGKEMRESTG